MAEPTSKNVEAVDPQGDVQLRRQSTIDITPPKDVEHDQKQERGEVIAFRFSWIVNVFLFLFKILAFVISGSQAILASLADSAVDLLSQVVLAATERTMTKSSEKYPVGRNRLEAIGVIACACIMSVCSAFVIESAGGIFYEGVAKGNPTYIDFDYIMVVILCIGTAAKFALWIYCRQFAGKSASILALAEDHLNDVVSNGGAIGAAFLAVFSKSLWWVDSFGAIVISVWIIARWYNVTKEQMEKLVGKTAPDSFVEKCNNIAKQHHRLLRVDVTRAYHMGGKYAVEMEVVLPPDLSLRETHDIALSLQHKIEALEDTERAFVHVDYTFRDEPEHKVERDLGQKASSPNLQREDPRHAKEEEMGDKRPKA